MWSLVHYSYTYAHADMHIATLEMLVIYVASYMGISCFLKLMKFTRAHVKLTRARALVGPGVDTPLQKSTRIYGFITRSQAVTLNNGLKTTEITYKCFRFVSSSHKKLPE